MALSILWVTMKRSDVIFFFFVSESFFLFFLSFSHLSFPPFLLLFLSFSSLVFPPLPHLPSVTPLQFGSDHIGRGSDEFASDSPQLRAASRLSLFLGANFLSRFQMDASRHFGASRSPSRRPLGRKRRHGGGLTSFLWWDPQRDHCGGLSGGGYRFLSKSNSSPVASFKPKFSIILSCSLSRSSSRGRAS